MLHVLAIAAAVALAAALGQTAALLVHLARGQRRSNWAPSVSVLKPLCGADPGLRENLVSFLEQDYPDSEVLFGVESERDPAFAVASEIAAAWPGRARVVLQDGQPGLNPKVNQLATLERHARGEVLVVSDSNVRVGRKYLRDLVAPLADAKVGVVTSPVAGEPGARLGGRLDALHLNASIAPGIAGLRLVGRPVFVGKSMAFRRADVAAVGGFAAFGYILSEDQALGEAMRARGLRGALARLPVTNVTDCDVKGFFERYFRWGLLQKHAAGLAFPLLFLSLSYPLLIALFLAALANPPMARLALVGIGARMLLDALAVRAITHAWPSAATLALSPLREIIVAAAMAKAAFTDRVTWRGKALRVGPGCQLLVADDVPLEALPSRAR